MRILSCFIALFTLCVASIHAYPKEALFLTWYDDPCTTMVIRVLADKKCSKPQLLLQTSQGEEPLAITQSTELSSGSIQMYTFCLEQLTPDTVYHFRFSDEDHNYSFKTLSFNGDFKFVVGGDICEEEKPFKKVLSKALEQNPDFIVLGGDIAYHTVSTWVSFKKNQEWSRWKRFFNLWEEVAGRRLYPILTCPGNHDVGPDKPKSLYLELMLKDPQGPTYNVFDIGKDFSLFLLDTGHFTSITEKQTPWLKENLEKRKDLKFRVAVYHVSAYPSYYDMERKNSPVIRRNWVPLFDEYKLTTAFENHNHSYKKTFPLKDNAINYEEGIIYFGDGCWGVPRRNPHNVWYLDKKGSIRHFYLVEKSQDNLNVNALDEDGLLVDAVILPLSPEYKNAHLENKEPLPQP